MSIKYELVGAEELIRALQSKGNTNWKKITNDSLLEMRDRAVATSNPGAGGTPEDTTELRQSVSVDLDSGVVGYTKDYAPHVEFGHRLVAFGVDTGRYIPGQRYLQTNLNIQEKLYHQDLVNEMKRGD